MRLITVYSILKDKNMLIELISSVVNGVTGTPIKIETFIKPGIKYSIVGLASRAVKEGLVRIESSLFYNGFRMPRKRISINLSPANIAKDGNYLDLPIAISILMADKQIPAKKLDDTMFIGELSLTGKLKEVKSIISIVLEAKKLGYKNVVVPYDNRYESGLIEGIDIYGFKSLKEVIDFIDNRDRSAAYKSTLVRNRTFNNLDFSDIKGQESAKRAILVSAAGRHNLVMFGPPGAGKSMLAERIPSIMPPLTLTQAVETTLLHSAGGILNSKDRVISDIPFRKPSHSINRSGFVGGGRRAIPGEISFAHNGVLFMDELPLYKRELIDLIRIPLDRRQFEISNFTYDSNFILIATMNPCSCGYYLIDNNRCCCTTQEIKQYLNKITRPLIDRIDLHIPIRPVKGADLIGEDSRDYSSSDLKELVLDLHKIQLKRYKNLTRTRYNSDLTDAEMLKFCPLNRSCKLMIDRFVKHDNISARGIKSIIKTARTVADLDHSDQIMEHHLASAKLYRCLDSSSWGER